MVKRKKQERLECKKKQKEDLRKSYAPTPNAEFIQEFKSIDSKETNSGKFNSINHEGRNIGPIQQIHNSRI